eukprot:4137320-Pleurochrysis_carterae.AAC.1
MAASLPVSAAAAAAAPLLRLLQLLLLLLPETGVSERTRPVGRYAHCAVSFSDSMVVYGGRGYQYNVHNLSPLRRGPRHILRSKQTCCSRISTQYSCNNARHSFCV